MRKRNGFRFALVVALTLSVADCANTQNTEQANAASESAAPPNATPIVGIGAETVITVHGKIVAVDPANKLVTLQGLGGKDVTLTVNNRYNLGSLKAGDRYVAQFTESISVVGKGPSNTPPVATLAAGLWTAAPGQIPGAVAAQRAQLVVVVAAIDAADQRVTLRAPDGSTENIHVTNPVALQGVQVGDQIAITLTQSVAIALDPEPSTSQ
jgi:hypothetical protein